MHSKAEARATPHPAPFRRLGSLCSQAAQKPPHSTGSSEIPGWGISKPVPEKICLEGPGRDAGTSWEEDTTTCPGQVWLPSHTGVCEPTDGEDKRKRGCQESQRRETGSPPQCMAQGGHEVTEYRQTQQARDHGLSRAEASRVTLPSVLRPPGQCKAPGSVYQNRTTKPGLVPHRPALSPHEAPPSPVAQREAFLRACLCTGVHVRTCPG